MKSLNSIADRVLNRLLANGRARASVTIQEDARYECRNYNCGSMGCTKRCCRWCPMDSGAACSAYSCGACVC
jgi:hypothetical protein